MVLYLLIKKYIYKKSLNTTIKYKNVVFFSRSMYSVGKSFSKIFKIYIKIIKNLINLFFNWDSLTLKFLIFITPIIIYFYMKNNYLFNDFSFYKYFYSLISLIIFIDYNYSKYYK